MGKLYFKFDVNSINIKMEKELIKKIEEVARFIKSVTQKLPSKIKTKTEKDMEYILKDYKTIKDINKLENINARCKYKLTMLQSTYPIIVRSETMKLNKRNFNMQKKVTEKTHEEVLQSLAKQQEDYDNFQGLKEDSIVVRNLKILSEVPRRRVRATLLEKSILERPQFPELDKDERNPMKEIDKGIDAKVSINATNIPEVKLKENNSEEETKTFVVRNGKVVEGKGERREEAEYENWCSSNADPEDIRRHRELLDRECFKGPKWEGITVRGPWDYEANMEDIMHQTPEEKISTDKGIHEYEKVTR